MLGPLQVRYISHRAQIPYRRRYRTLLADAFEVYLLIVRGVEQRVCSVLGREAPNWRAMYGCPACGYDLEGELPSRWQRMFCIDGNNSLKRLRPLGKRAAGDTRVFTYSDYYLPGDYVDSFANEVQSRKLPAEHSANSEEVPPNDRPQIADDDDTYPVDGVSDDSPLKTCTQNWKAAASEEKKRTWGIFEETGIFASACPHGFVLWITDMVRSGEL